MITLVALLSFCIVALVYMECDVLPHGPAQFVPSDEGDSPEIQQVVFAKVHKAASSTVQNILLRFAMVRNLSVLLPKNRSPIINQTGFGIYRHLIVPHPEGKDKFDILCNHVVYNEKEIEKYFANNASRVAILRDPMKQSISALVYYYTNYPTHILKKALAKYPKDPINEFLRHPKDFYEPNKKWGPMTSFINNRMSLDLGFDRYNIEISKHNATKIEAFIKRVEKEFDLVLISDYFDESMVLLRRKLGWSMKDVIYLKVNTAKHQPTSSPLSCKPNISKEVVQTFRQWDKVDYALYEHFLPRFLKTIKSEPHFEAEVRAFQEIQTLVKDYCFLGKTRQDLQITENFWTDSFNVSKYDCKLMRMDEVGLVNIARTKQNNRYKSFRNTSSIVRDQINQRKYKARS